MNKVLIVDVSESDRRLMSGLLVKHGYEPIAVKIVEVTKDSFLFAIRYSCGVIPVLRLK